MRLKRTIKKALLVTTWMVVGSGMLMLLLAANKKEKEHTCKKTVIAINGNGEKYAIDKADVLKWLQDATPKAIVGRPLRDFNLDQIEKKLKKNQWIGDADIYFDSQDALHVRITEKEPVVRVITAAGRSFYLDSGAHKMPLLDKVSFRLPVFTNFPDRNKMKQEDSALLSDIETLAGFITNDPFWNAQIAQVDIQPNRTFEAVPVVGDHIIKIGKAENIAAKFSKLFLFYKKVLRNTGFDKYSVLDIQFENQIVATHKGVVSPIDSAQLQQNIQELLNKNNLQLQKGLEGYEVVSRQDREPLPDTSATAATATVAAATTKPAIIIADHTVDLLHPTLIKANSNTTSKSGRKAKVAIRRVPKALMPKRT